MINKFLLVVFLVSFLSCKKSETPAASNFFAAYADRGLIKTLQNDVIKNGNIKSYEKLGQIYSLSENSGDFLYFSFLMANHYHYSKAYNYVYKELNTNINGKDAQTSKLSGYYLLVNVEKNNEDAKNNLSSKFDIDNIPKSKIYWDTLINNKYLNVSTSILKKEFKTINTKTFNNKGLLNKLKKDVLHRGDTICFKKLRDIYYLSGNQDDFLFYSIYMAHDFNYSEGYYCTFEILNRMQLEVKDENIFKLSLYYLIKSYEIGNQKAKNLIPNYFNTGSIPKSAVYWKTLN